MDDNGGKYSIYASSAGKSPEANIKVLNAGDATDNFVASLKDKVITLTDTPEPTANFDGSDETAKWFTRFDPAAVASLTVGGTEQKAIESFEFEFEAPFPMTFSSASDALLAAFGPPVGGSGARIPAPGLNSDGSILACGLDFTKTLEITSTVGDLFEYAGIPEIADELPNGIDGLRATLKKPTAAEFKRNALWFRPSSALQTTIRLNFQLDDLGKLQTVLGFALKGLTLKTVDLICKKRMVLALTENGPEAIDQGQATFSVECSAKAGTAGAPKVDMTAAIEFTSSGINLIFFFKSPDPLTGILRWLAWLIGDDDMEKFVADMLGKEENGTKMLQDINIRRLIVGLDTNKNKEKPSLASFGIDIEVSANLGRPTDQGLVIFLLSYNWSKSSGGFGTFKGQLWNDYDQSIDKDLLPYGESWTMLQPITPSPAKFIDLAKLIPGQTIQNIPDTIPSRIDRAYIVFSQDNFAIGGTISAAPISPSSAPQPYLGEVALNSAFSWGKSSAFLLDLEITAGLAPSKTSKSQIPAILTGSLAYNSAQKSWSLKASLTGLYASTLVEFFDSDSRDHVMPLIDSIAIEKLDVEYVYTAITAGAAKGKSVGSEFTINGALLIASLKLDLFFHHNAEGWEFNAELNTQDRDATIGDALIAILGDDSIELPEFVSNMKIVGTSSNAFRINVDKKRTKDAKGVETESFQFLAQINIGKLHLAFAQLHSADMDAKDPSKRLVKVAIDGFPDYKVDIPLVGELQQPIDELYYIWVQDPPRMGATTAELQAKVAGLTRKDIAQINTTLEDQLVVKDKFKDPKPTDLLVGPGSHFAVIIRSSTGERSCLLDYEFMKPKAQTANTNTVSTMALTAPGASGAGSKTDTQDTESDPSAQAPYKKKAGPLSISNVGLKYKDKKLHLIFDAIFDMGPLGFSLIGFAIEAEFVTLDKMPNLGASIEGLSAVFDKPPLTIAGIIRHGNDGGIDYYAGGLIVGFVPYQFQAAGFYGVCTPKDPKKKPFKSIFIFAKLNGPLVTLEFAEISGITGGFGYNSAVRTPLASEITDFPFIASTNFDGANSALDALVKLTDPGPAGWFQPLDGTYWAAAGMKVDAFKMLSLDAVVVVQFGTAVKLGIFAAAVADIPTAASPIKYAHVELGIAIVIDFDYGVMKVEAQLSPRSFIYHPSVHLTGGAALVYWFDAPHADRANVGNFVFTLGGYHAAFEVPPGYPNPPRLGISWSLGSCLSIRGEAYFAITPKACMGGGRLHASFSAGPLEAYFDAFADFLINYKPFHFMAQAGISVGVRFNIDFLFIHTHISVELGAELYLWGPPLAGRVHVDFWITSFDIDFGDGPMHVDAVSLYDFYQLILQAGEQGTGGGAPSTMALMATAEPSTESEPTQPPKNEGHVFLAQSGLLNPSDKPEKEQNEVWTVRGGTFSFVVGCKMAINQVNLSKKPDAKPIITHGDGEEVDVFSKPMRLQSPMTSSLEIEFSQIGVPGIERGWQIDKHIKFVPNGLWAKYSADMDPTGGNNNISELLNNSPGNMPLMMGVEVFAPKPVMADDPLPIFNVADADLQELDAEKPFPTPADSNEDWEPGKPFAESRDQYTAVVGAWKAPGWGLYQDGQQDFVSGWADVFGWDNSVLSPLAAIPKRLKKGFDNLYVAAPLLTK